jgi:uncharacterized protein DUF1918
MQSVRNTPIPAPRRGWIFDVEGRCPGEPCSAEILEVLDVPGYTLYRVRWDDGAESVFLPSRGHAAHPPAGAGG